ncbi:MAG: hypothetical protein LBD99_05860 [Candidatus Margulisbacteria bacterium]|jgi:hypothetical protein|nr:hypothetical protein [Candidatus Margulisiibacteriota bacterium]
MHKLLIALFIGLAAAVIDIAPMFWQKMDRFFVASAFFVWLVLGLFISRINFAANAFLNGSTTALLFILPMSFLIYKLDPKGLPIVIVTTIAPGGCVGYFSKLLLG